MFYALPKYVWSLGQSVFNPIKAGESESMYRDSDSPAFIGLKTKNILDGTLRQR